MTEQESLIPKHGRSSSVPVRDSPCKSIPTSALVANATLSLINLCCYLQAAYRATVPIAEN